MLTAADYADAVSQLQSFRTYVAPTVLIIHPLDGRVYRNTVMQHLNNTKYGYHNGPDRKRIFYREKFWETEDFEVLDSRRFADPEDKEDMMEHCFAKFIAKDEAVTLARNEAHRKLCDLRRYHELQYLSALENQLTEFQNTQVEPEPPVMGGLQPKKVWGPMDTFLKVPSDRRVVTRMGKRMYCPEPSKKELVEMKAILMH